MGRHDDDPQGAKPLLVASHHFRFRVRLLRGIVEGLRSMSCIGPRVVCREVVCVTKLQCVIVAFALLAPGADVRSQWPAWDVQYMAPSASFRPSVGVRRI